MKKSELKNGCVVELRNGDKCIKIEDVLINPYIMNNKIRFSYLVLDNYNNDLTFVSNDLDKYDIVKVNNEVSVVYGSTNSCYNAILEIFNMNACRWTWERKEHILTDKEREYLKSVINPVRDKVEEIIKFRNSTFSIEFIKIYLKDCDNISLYKFETNTQFKGMEANKEYTLKELGLEE